MGYQDVSRECDLVLKGGVASGVAYPELVLELAKQYRFRRIGGASVGAIAAAMTAAAELGREGEGFETLGAVPDFLQSNLKSLFQPDPRFRRVFNFLLRFQAGEAGLLSIISAGLRELPILWGGPNTLKALARHRFGMCSGLSVDGRPALTDWLSDQIEIASGRMKTGDESPPHRPLLFADLWAGKPLTDDEVGTLVESWQDSNNTLDALGEASKQIDLRMVTTNLSLRRPHELPFLNRNHFYDPEEMAKFMPAHVMAWMDAVCRKDTHNEAFRYLPTGALMPVILSTRMSLSFPFLLCALPIHQRVYRDGGYQHHQKLWFSDGGISSNFPVHMFDNWLPSRPTFGVSLDPFDANEGKDRVYLPMSANRARTPAYQHIEGSIGFLRSILNAAKDWQDQLQMLSTGHKERIVHICLDKEEGGLKLDMEPHIIERMGQYGAAAGRRLTGSLLPEDNNAETFDFEDHQWRRFLVLYERLEEDLETLNRQWNSRLSNGKTFGEHLEGIAEHPSSYANSAQSDRLEAIGRVAELAEHIQEWPHPLRGKLETPRPSPIMRIVSSQRQ